MHTFIIHYGELGLKGQNRPYFEKRLAFNLRTALSDLGQVNVRLLRGFLLVELEEAISTADAEARLARIPGVAYFAPVVVTTQDPEAIMEIGLRLARDAITAETTFKVETRRGDKRFPIHSVDFNRELGARIVAAVGARGKMRAPDVTLHVQIYPEGVYLFIRRIRGAGGLPVGTAGKVLCTLSGGIDSPAAAHMLLRRGCLPRFLHFHMLRADEVANSKIVALARQIMAPHRLPAVLHMAPAHPFQLAVMEHESRVELIVFRRFILRVAARLAAQHGALAIVTGDSLGQVASQTLQNLAITSSAVAMPVLRPLIGLDKLTIMALAEQIGTYELSIQPYQDPCSFRARHPATWAQPEQVAELEAQLDMEALVEQTLAQTQEIFIRWE